MSLFPGLIVAIGLSVVGSCGDKTNSPTKPASQSKVLDFKPLATPYCVTSDRGSTFDGVSPKEVVNECKNSFFSNKGECVKNLRCPVEGNSSSLYCVTFSTWSNGDVSGYVGSDPRQVIKDCQPFFGSSDECKLNLRCFADGVEPPKPVVTPNPTALPPVNPPSPPSPPEPRPSGTPRPDYPTKFVASEQNKLFTSTSQKFAYCSNLQVGTPVIVFGSSNGLSEVGMLLSSCKDFRGTVQNS